VKLQALIPDTPDTAERVRDLVAAILAMECGNQTELASAANAETSEWDWAIYLEHSTPEELTQVEPFKPVSIVNVRLDSEDLTGGSTALSQSGTATVFVDVFAPGSSTAEAVGQVVGETDAALRAWKVARYIRRILRAGPYRKLGVLSTDQSIGAVSVTSLKAFTLGKVTAIPVCGVRLTVVVQVTEYAPEYTAPPGEGGELTVVRPENGQPYFQLTTS